MKGKLFLIILFALIFAVQISWAQLTITTSGQIGIGITTPNVNTKLHVQHTDYYAGYFTSNRASGTTKIIRAEYTGTGSYDAIAVYGKSVPTPYYGYGGWFEGGWRGIYALATVSGTGSRFGIYAGASGGSDSNYGIYAYGSGGTANYAGYFSGNVTVTGTFSNPSDIKLKENIQPIAAVLPDLMKLEAKTFNYKKLPEYEHMNLPSGKRYGFIAQEVEAIFPELVTAEAHPSAGELEGKKDERPITYKSINYTALIPLLVEAIREQQKMIDDLKSQLKK
ncbi:MAG: tail fiber domain-containing protein [candidate division KSB1 bacterium]|nr:tail fiber domain-containing protein [candidate division KSB1 bacterium]MDZ7305114.1 tail fiber domain-containing protein [candidate division KSB1 bacterium]MDZ7314185.1 tail fiber domain-containing protein [candidate division KSB1 bacterium]